MSNPTTILGRFALDANEIFAGQTSDVWIVLGGLLPATPSYFPVHGLSLNGIPASPGDVISKSFKGGVDAVAAVAYVKRVTVADYTKLTDAVSTVTVAGVVFTFVSGAPSTHQVQIGSSNNQTASRLATALAAIVPASIASVSVSNAVVTITGLADGTDLTLTTNQSDALTLTTVTSGNAAVAGVAATATIQSQGSKKKQGTISQIKMNLTVAGTTETILFQFDTPSNSSTNTTIANGLVSILSAGINNTTPTGGRIISSNPLNTTEEIQTGMQAYFTDDTAFTVTGTNNDTVTITLPNEGADGNNIAIEVTTLNSVPSPNIDVIDNIPQTTGLAIHLGGQDSFIASVNPITVDVNVSNIRERFARITTGETLEISFKLYQDNNIDFLGYGINRATITYDDTSTYLMFGGNPITQTYAVVFVSQSKRVGGTQDVLVIYQVEPTALSINRSRGQAGGYDVKLSPRGFARQGDPVGYLKQIRKLG